MSTVHQKRIDFAAKVTCYLLKLSLICFISKTLSAQDHLIPTLKVKEGIYNLIAADHTLIYYDRSKSITHVDANLLLNTGHFSKYSSKDVPSKYKRGLFNNWIYFRVENMDSIPILLHLRGTLSQDSIFISEDCQLLTSDMINRYPTKDKFGILTVGFTNSYFFHLAPRQTLDILFKSYHFSYGVGSIIPKISDTKVFKI